MKSGSNHVLHCQSVLQDPDKEFRPRQVCGRNCELNAIPSEINESQIAPLPCIVLGAVGAGSERESAPFARRQRAISAWTPA